jgi:hypothetical protein
MTTALMCLLGFALWSVVLVSSIGAVRVFQVVTRQKRANEFPSGQPHGGDAYWRLNRAHMNALENLPIFGTVVVVGVMLNVDAPLFSQLAQVVLAARVMQSVIHVSSGGVIAVNARFTAFLTQIVCIAWMALLIVAR